MNNATDATLDNERLEALLRALLDPGAPDLPAATGMSCTQIAVLAADPRAVELIQSLTRLIEHRARIAAAHALVGAIAALEKVMHEPIQNPRHAETIRKAAGAILRLRDSLHRNTAPPAATDRSAAPLDQPHVVQPTGRRAGLAPPHLPADPDDHPAAPPHAPDGSAPTPKVMSRSRLVTQESPDEHAPHATGLDANPSTPGQVMPADSC